MSDTCTHLDEIIDDVGASGNGCVDCLKIGGRWLHLRRCTECGHIGCCDSSPTRHAIAHFHGISHPIVQSYDPGEEWFWCYVDQVGFEMPADGPGLSHT